MLRDELKCTACIQAPRVIVDVHRRNAARSMLAPTGIQTVSTDRRSCFYVSQDFMKNLLFSNPLIRINFLVHKNTEKLVQKTKELNLWTG